MAGHPSAGALIAAVREFVAGLTQGVGDAPPALEGRDAFHVKVAANALAIVERELAAGEPPVVLGHSDADLCAAIRAGTLDVATPGLLDALIAATRARLAVDNPRYPTLARLDPASSPDAAVRR